jgi:putative addiction module killer protein
MFDVSLTDKAIRDIQRFKDRRALAKIYVALERFRLGNFGDIRPVGNGVSETRIHYAKGYRIYHFFADSGMLIVAGVGTKSQQDNDILHAKKLKQTFTR